MMQNRKNYSQTPLQDSNLIIRFINGTLCYYDLFLQVCKRYLSELRFSKKIVCLILGSLFLLSLIPLFLISCYNFPSADDYSFGYLTHVAWEQTHSLWAVLEAAFQQMCLTYIDWQGTYSAVFLMSLQPAVFGNYFYRFVPFLMLFMLISSSLYLWKVVLIDWLKSDVFTWLLVALSCLYMSIQYLPSPVEGFYWYNGSLYYTFYYSCSLFFYAILLKSVRNNRKSGFLNSMFLLLYSLFIAGGNFVTALLSVLLVFTLYLYGLYWKRSTKIVLFCLVALVAGFAVSVLAPGNAVRQALCQHVSVLKAVLESFHYSLVFIIKIYTTVSVLIILSLLILPIYQVVSASSYSFRRPWLFLFLSFCLFSSQLAPPYYAMGYTGPDRLLNIVYFSYWWFVVLNLIYLLGWLSCRMKSGAGMRGMSNCYIAFRPYLVVGYIFLLFSLLWISMYNETTSISASKSLYRGEASRYGEEMSERIRCYEGAEKRLSVEKLSVTPKVLFWTDIEADSCFWCNRNLAKYYDKISISVLDRE